MNKKRSFTLIETMVVIAVIGLALPVLFNIIFVILQQQTKIYRLAEIKRQGDYALNVISTTVRNYAISTHTAAPPASEVCANTATNVAFNYFRDKYDNSKWFKYELLSNKIASNGSNLISAEDLTTARVRVENLTITCSRTARYSTPVVSIKFDICYENGTTCATTPSRVEEIAKMTYQTNVKLRN